MKTLLALLILTLILFAQTGPTYHGGPVLDVTSPLTVYYIWYGSWTPNHPSVSVLDTLAQHIGGSPYFLINSSYRDANNQPLTGAVNFGGQTFDGYSQGPSLNDEFTVVSHALQAGSLPIDENAVYYVLTSADVPVVGFCTTICGRHRSAIFNGANIKYAFVGDPSIQCAGFCSRWAVGPNGPGGVDAMASIIAHELDESVTNPNGNAWYNGNGDENADLCIFQYGHLYKTRTHAPANMNLGGLDFIIQENWRNTASPGCALSLTGK